MNLTGKGRWWDLPCAAALVAAPIFVLFAPALCSDRSLAMRDAAHFYHPLLEWTSKEWLRGSPPLWNPNENTGMPLLADASSSLFYPGRLLLLLPIDFVWRYKLYVVGHVILAALGSYLLARHWRASIYAAAVAAIAYSCGGSVVFQHCNVVFLVGAAWLPFAVWATDRMLVARSWRAAVALGMVLAMMVLGGDPQMAYHALLMAGLYALLNLHNPDAQAKDTATGRMDACPSLARRACGSITRIGLAACSAFALTAVQVLPSAEATASSERAYFTHPRNIYEASAHLARSDGGRESGWASAARGLFGQPEPTTHHERLYDFSVPPWRLVEYVWPNIGGRMFPTHRRWMSFVPAEGRIWTPTLYLGVVPLLLALWQWRIRRAEPQQTWLSWLLLLFTLGSFGWYGLGWGVREFYATVVRGDPSQIPIGSQVGGLYWLLVTVLPGYVNFRYPAKLAIIAALAASQLAARGMDRWLSGPSPRLLAVIRWLATTSVVLLVICWLGLAWLNGLDRNSTLGRNLAQFLAAHGDSSLGPFDFRGCQRDVYGALIQTLAACLAAHWLLRRARQDDRSRWRWGLTALVAIDLAVANYWLVPTAPADTWRTRPSVIAGIESDAPVGDAAGSQAPRVYRASLMRWRPRSFSQTASTDRMAQIATWERDTLFPKYGLNHGISLVESYGSLKSVDGESLLFVARQQGPIMPGKNGREMPHPDVLRLLGTEYLVVPDHWRPVTADGVEYAEPARALVGAEIPEGAALWRLVDPLPRAWIVHQVEQMPSLVGRHQEAVDERTRDVLFPRTGSGNKRLARDFRTSAVVETDLTLELSPGAARPEGEDCRIVLYRRERVEIEATLNSPGLVVLSDMFAPGWIATVETQGVVQAAVILRTNRVCRGILLPAGNHRIRYEYHPGTYSAGAWMSGAAWLAVALAFGWRVAMRRQPRQVAGALR